MLGCLHVQSPTTKMQVMQDKPRASESACGHRPCTEHLLLAAGCLHLADVTIRSAGNSRGGSLDAPVAESPAVENWHAVDLAFLGQDKVLDLLLLS